MQQWQQKTHIRIIYAQYVP